jgi:hypothetical protein
MSAFSQQIDLLRTIALSPSMSLLVTRSVEQMPNTRGITLQSSIGANSVSFHSIHETYTVALKAGNVQVKLEQAQFQTIEGAEDSVTPRFAVYDAVLDGNTLRYFFVNNSRILLATARVDGAGAVSGYQQKALPEKFARIDTARFVKGKDGRVTLKVREPGKKTRDFQFDGAGEAVNVPEGGQ